MADADVMSRFNDELRRRSEALAEAVCQELTKIGPRPIDDGSRAAIRTQIDELLAEPLRDPADPLPMATTARGRAELVKSCRLAVRSGLAIDDLLRGFRASLEIGIDFCEAAAAELDVDQAARLAASRRLLAWSNLAMSEASEAYRQELIPTTDRLQRYAPVLSAIRTGVALTSGQIRDLGAAGFELSRTWHAVLARPVRSGPVNRVAQEILPHDDTRLGIVAVADGLVLGLLAAPPLGPSASVRAGIGPPVTGPDLHRSFEFAERALEAGTALGLRGVHALEDLGVRAAVATDKHLGDALIHRYITPVEGTSGGRDTLEALNAYLAADASVRVAAKRLGLHENTIRYRLGRYEELTGIHLRVLTNRFEAWWALTAYDER